MKRLVTAVIGICLVGSVLAQGSFTIVRPENDSKVRENVRVLIPRNSLEDGAYIGVFLGGKFVEAVVPPVDANNPNYRVYTLNTKLPRASFPEWRNGIPDGEVKLELVKYMGGDQPRIVDRSSVSITVANHMNIKVPGNGIRLRYAFQSGRQLVYRVQETVSVSTLSGVDNTMGGRPAELPAEDLSARILYAVDNAYGDGQALLRMQYIPDKGKDYSILLMQGEAEPRKVTENEMAPVYMRVKNTGAPVYGTIPAYFGFAESGSGGVISNVVNVWPLPVLPEKPVAPGSTWETGYQLPAIDENKRWELNKVTQAFKARGEFVAVEWERGHPCAKLRNSIAAGTRSFEGQQLEKAGRAFGDDKVALEETLWFALDTRQIIKRVRSITIDQKLKVQDTSYQGGAAGGGAVAGGGAGGPAGGPARSGGLSGGGGGGGAQGAGFTFPPTPNFQGGKGAPGEGGPRKGTGGLQGGGGLTGGGGMGQRSGGGGAVMRTQYIRQRYEQVFTLEQ